MRCATNEVSTQSLRMLEAPIDTRADTGVPVIVFNSLAWQRGGAAEVAIQMPSAEGDGLSLLDAKKQVVPSQVLSYDAKTNTYRVLFHLREVPSLGYVVLHAVHGKRTFQSDLKSLQLEAAPVPT